MNKKSTNEIVQQWKKSHLLNGLSEVKEVTCAIALEEMAQILIQNKQQLTETYGPKNSDDICGVLLPIVRRLFSENIKLMPSMNSLFEHYVKHVAPDPEAALVSYYVQDAKNYFDK